MHSLRCAFLVFSARELQGLAAAWGSGVNHRRRTATAAIPRFSVLSGPTSPVVAPRRACKHLSKNCRWTRAPVVAHNGPRNCPRTAPVESRRNIARGIVTSKNCVTVLLVHTGHDVEHPRPEENQEEHSARGIVTRKKPALSEPTALLVHTGHDVEHLGPATTKRSTAMNTHEHQTTKSESGTLAHSAVPVHQKRTSGAFSSSSSSSSSFSRKKKTKKQRHR